MSEQEQELFELIDIDAIPKTHRGKSNETYDKVLDAFKEAKNEAIKVNCSGFGTVKPSSVAHTFRMRIRTQKLSMRVQLDAHNKAVYLVKLKAKA